MLIDFSLLILRRFGKCAPGLDQQIFPPSYLMHSSVIDPSGPIKGINSSLPGLVVFLLDHQVDFLELIINLLENNFVLIVKHLLILLHFDIHMLDPF